MSLFLADVKVHESYREDYAEQDKSRRRSASLLVTCKRIVDITDHSIERLTADRLHILTEDTDDARILLEASDEAGDNNVSYHGRKERNGDPREYSYSRSTVDLRSLVILLVYALETAEKNEDLEGERVPYYVDYENGYISPIVRALVDPVYGIYAEEAEYVIDDTVGHVADSAGRRIDSSLISNDIEHCLEYHSDRDGVGNVRKEEYRLKESLKGLDRVKAYRDNESEDSRDRNGRNAEYHSRLEAISEALILNDVNEVLNAELKLKGAAYLLKHIVLIPKRHTQSIEYRPYGEYEKKHDSGGKIEPTLPFIELDLPKEGIKLFSYFF